MPVPLRPRRRKKRSKLQQLLGSIFPHYKLPPGGGIQPNLQMPGGPRTGPPRRRYPPQYPNPLVPRRSVPLPPRAPNPRNYPRR